MPPSQCGRPVELSCGDDWPPLSPSSKKCSLGRPSILHLPVLVLQLSRSTSTTSRRTGDLWAGLTSSTLRPLPICVPRLCGKKVCWQAASDVENQLSIVQQVGDFKGASISYLSMPVKCPRMSYQDQCIARYLSELHKKWKVDRLHMVEFKRRRAGPSSSPSSLRSKKQRSVSGALYTCRVYETYIDIHSVNMIFF